MQPVEARRPKSILPLASGFDNPHICGNQKGVFIMTEREKLIAAIERMMQNADREVLEFIYYFLIR